MQFDRLFRTIFRNIGSCMTPFIVYVLAGCRGKEAPLLSNSYLPGDPGTGMTESLLRLFCALCRDCCLCAFKFFSFS